MKKLIIALSCLFSLVTQASPLTVDQIYFPQGLTFFSQQGGSIAMPSNGFIGDALLTLDTGPGSNLWAKEAYAVYDFATYGNGPGGAGYVTLPLPAAVTQSNAVIYNAWYDVSTAVTPTGASMEIHGLAAGDILATTALSSSGTVAQHQGVPVAGTITHAIKGATSLVIHFTTNPITAGHFTLFLDYSLSQ